MQYYTGLLKIIGIYDLFQIESKDNVLINIVVNNNKEVEQQIVSDNYKGINKNVVKKIINVVYFLLILLLISWSFAYALIISIINKDIKYLINDDISYMFIIQYLFGAYYYKTDHFKNVLQITKIHTKRFKFILFGGFIINILLPIVSILLYLGDVNINIYSKIEYSKILMGIILFLDKFYKYNIFLCNIIIFALILRNHAIAIHNYSINLDTITNVKTEEITLKSIIQEYNTLKQNFNDSVSALNNMFSSVTIAGIIGAYFTIISISNGDPSVLIYIDLAYFFIIECIYIYIIHDMRNKVNSIIEIVNSQKIMEIFLNRNAFESFSGDVYKLINTDKNTSEDVRITKELSIRNMIRINENSHSIDWLILNIKLNDKWDSFSFMGFEISDIDMIKKLGSIIVGFLMLTNLNQILDIVQFF